MPTPNKFRWLYFSHRIFTFLVLFFLAGILFSSFLTFQFSLIWPVIIIISLGLIFSALINFLLKNTFLVLISFCFIFFVLALCFYTYFDQRTAVVLPFNQKVEFTGRIVKPPVESYKDQQFVIQTDEIKANSQTILQKRANLLVKTDVFPRYYFGETIHISGQILEPQNFSDFDYRSYLKRYLIFGTVNQPEITFINSCRGIYWQSLNSLYLVGQYFEGSINRIFPEPQASLASGLILGIKRNIPDDLMAAFKTDGLTHIIALSGFNVTIIIILLTNTLIPFIGRKYTFAVGLPLILAFVAMTGAPSSVVRAAIFSLMILFGQTIGRQSDKTNLMLVAALAMVLFNPFVERFDLGFQLSFFAFAGLIYLGPLLKNYFEKKKIKKWPVFLKSTLAETLGAQIGVMPIIWLQFGTVSLISPIANLLVVWIIPYAMLLVFVAGILGLIYYPLGLLAGLFAWPALEYIIKMTELLAKLPFASLNFR